MKRRVTFLPHLIRLPHLPGVPHPRVNRPLIGVTETKITNSNENRSFSCILGYVFDIVPTPLASGGVGLFIHESLNYTVLEKISNEDFQALWIEISFADDKNIICGIIYRQHNSPDQLMSYFEETIENLTSLNKLYLSCLGRFQYRSIEMRNISN